MKEVVICNPLRTANGSFGGAFKTVPAYDLAKTVMQRVIADSGIDAGTLDDVIIGNIGQPSKRPTSRVSAIYAGIPLHVPAYTTQRNCASAIQAITNAYAAIQAEDGELFLVGGTENMSQIPYVVKGAVGSEAAPRRVHRRPVGGPHRPHLQPDHGRDGREPGRAVQHLT